MKKYSFIICFLFCLIFFKIFPADIYPPDIKRIIDNKKIRVAFYPVNLPPFFTNTPRRDGFDINLMHKIADAFGVDLEIIDTAKTSDDVINLVSEGKAEIAVSELSITLQRAKKVNFTDPYVVLIPGLLVNKGQWEKYDTAESIIPRLNQENMKIAYLKDSSFAQFSRELFKFADHIGYSSWDEIIDAISKKEVDAGFVDEITVKTFSLQHPEKALDIKTIEILKYKDPIAIAINPGYPNLRLWLNTFIKIKGIRTSLEKILEDYDYLIPKKKK